MKRERDRERERERERERVRKREREREKERKREREKDGAVLVECRAAQSFCMNLNIHRPLCLAYRDFMVNMIGLF